MKKRPKQFWLALIPLTISGAASLALSTLSTNPTNSPNQVFNLAQQRADKTLSVGNTTIDLNDPKVNSELKRAFEPFYPEDFKSLLIDPTKAQYLLKYLVSYKDQLNNPAIFKTELTFDTFYNNFSQAKEGFFDPEAAVTFAYDNDTDRNPMSSIANGTMRGIVKIGSKLTDFNFQHNAGTANNDNKALAFELQNLRYQFDIYFRNEALGKDHWDKDNVADDNIVKPFVIEGRANKSLLEEGLVTTDKVKEFILKELITYDNNNGKAVEANKNTNAILATNLSKNDFKNRNILNNIFIEPFVGSGKIKIGIRFNTYSNKNTWLDAKAKSLTDKRGIFSQLPSSGDVFKVFWLSGWKKDYSFERLKQENPELDALTLSTEQPLVTGKTQVANSLAKYTAKEIEALIDLGEYDELFKGLIHFGAYSQTSLIDKLLKTNLIYEEFQTLIKTYPFSFVVNNYDDDYLDDFQGKIKAKMVVNRELVQQNYVNSHNNGNGKYVPFNDSSPVGLDFGLKNLKRKMFFKPKTSSYIKVKWLETQTIKEFFRIQLGPNGSLSDTDLKTIKEKVLQNFVKFNHASFDDYNENDYKIFPILTNAKQFDHLNSATETLTTGDVKFDHGRGQMEINFRFKFKNGTLNNLFVAKDDEATFTIPVKISGFKPDLTQAKFTFELTKPPTTSISIQEFNKVNPEFIASANEIDPDWIWNNLIQYQTKTNPNALFKTTASKAELLAQMLYTSQNNPGMNLVIKGDGSAIDGTIYLKKEAVTNPPNFDLDPNKAYYTYHFQIFGFIQKPTFDFRSHFNIQVIAPDLDLSNLDENYLIQNLFAFSDVAKKYYILKTNLTKNHYLQKVLKNLTISRDFASNTATVTITQDKQAPFTTIISGFNSQANFSIHNEIYLDDPELALVRIDNQDSIFAQFMNFDGKNDNQNSILNTNISLGEFQRDYLKFFNIKNKNFQGNWLDLTLELKKQIANQDVINFRIFFNKAQINIFNINKNFSINKPELEPNGFNRDDVLNYISFNGSLAPSEALFTINLSRDEFLKRAEIKKNFEPNVANGSIEFRLVFQMPINVDDAALSGNTNLKSYEFKLFGFKATGKINFNSQVNAAAYPNVFAKIQAIGDLDDEFIFKHLIAYEGSAKGIIGNTNLKEAELRDNTSINVSQQGNSAVIEFNFKSQLNGNWKRVVVQIINLEFLGYAKYNLAYLATLATILTILSLGGIGLLVWLVLKRKQARRTKMRFRATNDNKIF